MDLVLGGTSALSPKAAEIAAMYDALSDESKAHWEPILMAMQSQKATSGTIPVDQSEIKGNDGTANQNKKQVSLVSSQPEPKSPKGANLGTFGGSVRATPKESNAGHKANRVRK